MGKGYGQGFVDPMCVGMTSSAKKRLRNAIFARFSLKKVKIMRFMLENYVL